LSKSCFKHLPIELRTEVVKRLEYVADNSDRGQASTGGCMMDDGCDCRYSKQMCLPSRKNLRREVRLYRVHYRRPNEWRGSCRRGMIRYMIHLYITIVGVKGNDGD
jgi:hypothetical protein